MSNDLAADYRKCPGDLSALLDVADQLAEFLTESHQDEINRNHYGDQTNSCSYCAALAEFKEVRESIMNARRTR